MPATLRCVAIDDEPIALEVIKSHASKVPFLELKKTFVNAIEALTYLKTEPIDLIFLDINMPDLTGLDFAQVVGTKSLVIFTTAYPEYALQGFELSALDYLLKPIAFGRFMQAANKAYERLSGDSKKSPYVFVKDGYDWVRINLDELQYVESEGNYLTFQETGKKALTRMTISEAAEMLPNDQFMRVHKSYIVALNRIEKIERHQLTIGKVQVPLSGSYRDELLERVK
ncbi:LytR/AlgR family response regulator transcription factor [Spirosoma sp. KUDC1026]|uniref:LytR/AlgR family response regulator transcription factor n=1 Tax=Spirosoma sp. KUDC1026 TaxID=2745947 RepID=UPI00159B91C6|nr:LytTR family DNA-binding domain-containing protein [Spirosoma sp. KUDC1026]QKZ11766.1 response regulator transcription factor [Spirosoma sp. KUDC1026]